MTKNKTWKRVAAGVLSLALVAGMMPANVGGLLTEGAAIVAHADDAVPTDETITLYYDSDTEADSSTLRTYQGTYAGVSGKYTYQVFNGGTTIVKGLNVYVNNVVTITAKETLPANYVIQNVTFHVGGGSANVNESTVAVSSGTVTNYGQDLTIENVNSKTLKLRNPGNRSYDVLSVTITYGEKTLTTLTAADVEAVTTTYTGSALTPTIKIGDTTLTNGTDYTYTVTDSNNQAVDSVVNAGTYHVKVTAVNGSDYTGEKTVEWIVSKATLELTAPELTYNGSPQALIAGSQNIPAGVQFNVTTPSDYENEIMQLWNLQKAAKNDEAGDAQAAIGCYADAIRQFRDGNQEGLDARINQTIYNAELVNVSDTDTKDYLIYIRKNLKGKTAEQLKEQIIAIAKSRANAWSETVPTGTDAGSYTVWYKGNENFTDDSVKFISATINPVTLDFNDLAAGGALVGGVPSQLTYNGEEQAVKLYYRKGDTYVPLTAGTDYELNPEYPDGGYFDGCPVYSAATDASDDYEVVINPKGNYKLSESNELGTLVASWSIAKANPTADLFNFTAPENLYSDGTAKTATIVPATGVSGMGEITRVLYTKDGEPNSETETPTDAGTYKAYVFTNEGANYKSGTALTRDDWTFTISNYTVSNTLYFTNALTDLTKDAAASAAENTLSNLLSVTEYTDDVKLSDTIYAELTDDDDEDSVVQIASITANDKVYDGKPYNPTLSVKTECRAGFSFDVPEYYEIVTDEEGKKTIVSLGTDAPTEKGSYLVSYSVLRGGTAIRNKYLYAPFTIGARAITDYVVTADLNHDQKISADEFFGGVNRPEARDFITAEQYFVAYSDKTAEDLISEIKDDPYNSYRFAPLDNLLKLYATGQDYELNVYPFSVYQNEEGTWEVVQLKETTDEVAGDFTVEDNMKAEVGSYTVKVTAPEYVGTKEIPWAINKNKVTDYLVGVDVNHDGTIMADELFGTLIQNPENQVIEDADTLAGSANLSNISAQNLIDKLFKAETGNAFVFNPFYRKNVKFNDLADLENVLEYDGKPYELKVQPFSVMEGRNGYSTVLLDSDGLNIGGTPSKVVAGEYVLEVQSSDYEIAVPAEQGSNVAPTNTIRVPWAIRANGAYAQFGTVYKEDSQDYYSNESGEVTLQYTGKPAVIPTFWRENPDSGYDPNAVYFFVEAENTKLPVNFYHYDSAKSMWVEGMPTEVGNYQVAAVYNGTMDAAGVVKQVNRNVKASSDMINLTITPAEVVANVHAESEYGSKLADIKDIELKSDLTVDGKEISEMVDVTAKLAGADIEGLVLNAGSYAVELTIKPKEGYEDVLKNFDFGADESGKVIVQDAYVVTQKEITEDMVSFTSKYVKPSEDGMVNPGDMTVKFDGYDAAGNAQEIVLTNGIDYKTYGATQASGEATYEMDLVGVGENYTGVATVSWVVDARSEVEITGKYAEVKSVSYNADTKKLKFNARMTIPDDAVMTKLGIIATSDASIKYNLTLDTAPEAGVTFVKATATGLEGLKGTNYTWTKTAVEKDDVWYAVPYVCYELNGETVTKYGALVEATAEGVTPVELATAEYVSAEYANEKLKFNTLVSIPDGCTMDAIGVCATSNAETAENLTIDTPAVTGETYIKKVDTGLEGITKTGYHWTKTAVEEGTTWFVKPYVTYTDADGVQQTIYGDLKAVTAKS